MNNEEIEAQVEQDMPEILLYIDSREAKYRREVIKATRFPLYFEPKFKKTKAGNTWLILFEAKSKKEKRDSMVSFVCYFQSAHGYYAVMPTSTNGRFHYVFYQPHFFSRYALRMGIEGVHGVDLIALYFKLNHTYAYEIHTHLREIVNVVEVYGSSLHGVAMGVVLLSGSYFFRTFITYDMLKGEQVAVYTRNETMRREIHE